ncbi:MAG: hypothetical protein VCF24_28550 [Candidatus Latescibacterota bacterium]|jgi:hypothetical protein
MDVSTWVLSQLLPPPAMQFRLLVAALSTAAQPRFVTAELHDFLQPLTSSEFSAGVVSCAHESLQPYWANYLAAMVEVAARNRGLPAPKWTRHISPLNEPSFGTDLLSLRLYLLTHSPIPFRRRNIFVDATIGERV